MTGIHTLGDQLAVTVDGKADLGVQYFLTLRVAVDIRNQAGNAPLRDLQAEGFLERVAVAGNHRPTTVLVTDV